MVPTATRARAYAYAVDRDILDQWTWRETFASQPDILAYIGFLSSPTTTDQPSNAMAVTMS